MGRLLRWMAGVWWGRSCRWDEAVGDVGIHAGLYERFIFLWTCIYISIRCDILNMQLPSTLAERNVLALSPVLGAACVEESTWI